MGLVVAKRRHAFSLCFLAMASATDFSAASTNAPVVALGGAVVLPGRVLPHGWVVIKDGRIADVRPDGPHESNVQWIETHGVISAGFIDLHNHPMYAAFPRWNPGKHFANRYEWRSLPEYERLLGSPARGLQEKDDETFCDLDEFAEVMAVIGGTTSISGISGRQHSKDPVPPCLNGFVRNLDWASGFYDAPTGRERLRNSLGITPKDLAPSVAAEYRTGLAAGAIDLLLFHLAEGSTHDLETSLEFSALEGQQFLGPHVGLIHGVGLQDNDFRAMHAANVGLVWSPRSNLELYGETTNIASAMQARVMIAIAPDWSPTGSVNLLAEIRYAHEYLNKSLPGVISDEDLFHMGTTVPARLASIEDRVGRIEPGLLADLVVYNTHQADVFASIAQATQADVELVMVGGKPLYGTNRLLRALHARTEQIEVCGRSMALSAAELPAGSFGAVTTRLSADLAGYGIALAQIGDCSANDGSH
jgi:5-methylthioadenosine/S-adenosylhomocysteine deaminase